MEVPFSLPTIDSTGNSPANLVDGAVHSGASIGVVGYDHDLGQTTQCDPDLAPFAVSTSRIVEMVNIDQDLLNFRSEPGEREQQSSLEAIGSVPIKKTASIDDGYFHGGLEKIVCEIGFRYMFFVAKKWRMRIIEFASLIVRKNE